MGCSDRFDLPYCEYKIINFPSGAKYSCGKITNGGIYCTEHKNNVLPKEDAEEVISKIKQKNNCLIDWIDKK